MEAGGDPLSLTERVLERCQAEQAEVVFYHYDNALTRFANNIIHQNVAERQSLLTLRTFLGKRLGIARTTDLSQEGLKRLVDRALTTARAVPGNPQLPPFPHPSPVASVADYQLRTAEMSPEQRASAVAVVCHLAEEKGLNAAGAFSTGSHTMVVANSQGVRAQASWTLAQLSTVVHSDTSSGYAERLAVDAGEIDAEQVAGEALERAVKSQGAREAPPGSYEVVLEPYAVSDILDFLAMLGFSALAIQEGRSFMAGRLGQRVAGENISIWDDGLNSSGVPMPFDYEGVPKQRVDFITRGVATSPCYDTLTASKEGKSSTGHALPLGQTFGPMPTNLFLQAGESSRQEMIASVKRGLLVTRFWYTRVVHPLRVVMTGMTRDGTFLIENGEIVGPVRNLRFTHSYLEALNSVEGISRETQLLRTGLSFNRVPLLYIGQWQFTGATTY